MMLVVYIIRLIISFDNTMSIEEIKNTREKIVILEKLFAVLIFKYGIK